MSELPDRIEESVQTMYDQIDDYKDSVQAIIGFANLYYLGNL
jgi:hypothetical protein